jgi:hypothetical protein
VTTIKHSSTNDAVFPPFIKTPKLNKKQAKTFPFHEVWEPYIQKSKDITANINSLNAQQFLNAWSQNAREGLKHLFVGDLKWPPSKFLTKQERFEKLHRRSTDRKHTHFFLISERITIFQRTLERQCNRIRELLCLVKKQIFHKATDLYHIILSDKGFKPNFISWL